MKNHKRLKDDVPVEFIATADDKGCLYSLVVQCEQPLTEEEYALCLLSFAEDIIENRFSFENNSNVVETISQ